MAKCKNHTDKGDNESVTSKTHDLEHAKLDQELKPHGLCNVLVDKLQSNMDGAR